MHYIFWDGTRGDGVALRLICRASSLCAGLTIALVVCSAPTLAVASGVRAPELKSSTHESTDGSFRLFWGGASTADDARFELQQSNTPSFAEAKRIYLGPDRATVVSGAPNGIRYFRIRLQAGTDVGPWSPPLKVVVRHHSLAKALLFFGIGAVVFLATLVMIVIGNGRDRRRG